MLDAVRPHKHHQQKSNNKQTNNKKEQMKNWSWHSLQEKSLSLT